MPCLSICTLLSLHFNYDQLKDLFGLEFSIFSQTNLLVLEVQGDSNFENTILKTCQKIIVIYRMCALRKVTENFDDCEVDCALFSE